MIKLCVILALYAHWQACFWGLISSYMQDQIQPYPNWIQAFEDSYADTHDGLKPQPLEVYVAALYWSVMTLTSIGRPCIACHVASHAAFRSLLAHSPSPLTAVRTGYGEMTPVNTTERWLCSIWMMLSGVMWTYAIGSVAAIATTLDPNRIIYETTMVSPKPLPRLSPP